MKAMEYILKGNPRYVEKVREMASYLEKRGDVKFIPLETHQVGILAADDKIVVPHDDKTPHAPDRKKPKKPTE